MTQTDQRISNVTRLLRLEERFMLSVQAEGLDDGEIRAMVCRRHRQLARLLEQRLRIASRRATRQVLGR